MAAFESVESWVVYRLTLSEKSGSMNGVCDQTEWEALRTNTRGQLTLIKSGISTEGEAEKIARGVPK